MKRAAVAVPMLVLLAACSGGKSSAPPVAQGTQGSKTSPPTSPATQASSSAASGTASYSTAKVCSLLSPADIKTATGQDVAAGAIGDQQPGLWVECRYYAGSQLLVRVQLAEPAHAQDAYTGNCQATDPATIPGADKACWDSALGAVNVLKGGLELGVIYDNGTVKTDQAKTTALTVAALANVGKLN
jgi:hypothetical protein